MKETLTFHANLPIASIFFTFKVDPFSEGGQINFESVTSLESVSISLTVSSNTVKNSRTFYGKYWKLVASAVTVNFTGARRTFAGITS